MKKNNEINRIKQLVQSFDEKHEVLKETKDKNINQDALLKEVERLKEIDGRIKEGKRIDEWIANPTINQTVSSAGGHGVTVNSFIPNTAEQNVKMYNPNFTYLQASEALFLCIKRAIESGAPINNIGFYEEINWNLNNMGFNSRMPIDIKVALKKMIN